MPMLKFKGIPKEEILAASTTLIDELVAIIDCPRDYFTLEVIDNVFVMDGVEVVAPTMIEVAWFDRGQEVKDQVAKAITSHFAQDRACVEVVFYGLAHQDYYENGEHF